jgi:aspartyl-tRNA(Asn)/glutamyl-tRNA(Gln) amidotransferase subunit A
MSQSITKMTVSELSDRLQARDISAVEAACAYIEKIKETDADIGAYLLCTHEIALKQAETVDKLRAEGKCLPPLAGIPAGIKDNICTKGIATTCASRMLESFVPPYNATVMDLLQQSHVVMLGKLNMDEFAMGSTNETSYFKPVQNPRDLTRVSGGSSGGSAAAVAAEEAAFALGSDTGGSIRQPAAFCGVVGMKPTYGAVSRNGLIAVASSFDQIGPLTRNVRDSALVMQAIAGYDPNDATSFKYDRPSFTDKLGEGVKGLKIALLQQYSDKVVDGEIRDAIRNAARHYEKLGAFVEEVSLPNLRYALPAYYVISSAEASSNLARYDGVKYGYRAEECSDIDEIYKKTRSQGFGSEVKRRIMLGNYFLSAGNYDLYYKKALQVRTIIRNDFEEVFKGFDIILSPVTLTTAYRIGETKDNALKVYMGELFTVPVNIAGLPAISLPCGVDSQRMPIGMQLIGKSFEEPLLYRAAYAFEQSCKWEV